jgi:hypothetical protein
MILADSNVFILKMMQVVLENLQLYRQEQSS